MYSRDNFERNRIKAEICLRCGARCCRGIDYKNWYIRVTLRDIVRIAEALGKSIEEVARNYIVLISQGTYSIPVLRAVQGSCIFLKNTVCTIHRVKPIACRVYPVIPPGDRLDLRCELSRFPELLQEERAHVRQYVEEFLETDSLLSSYHVRNTADLVNVLRRLFTLP